MKKKVAIALVSLMVASFAVQAQSSKPQLGVCPFNDNFYITGATIQKLSGDGNLAVTQISNTNFTTGCKDNNSGNDGNVYLTVASPKGSCSLVIVDGPFENNPYVQSSSCQGTMQSGGIDHPSMYQYVVKFN